MKDYKKILEGVVNIISTTETSDIGFANICAYIGENCPELKESEDERIRKWLIAYLENRVLNTGILEEKDSCKEAVAWIEKQGEQKSTNKIEPEFKVGDVIRSKKYGNKCTMTIKEVLSDSYITTDDKVLAFEYEDKWELAEPKQCPCDECSLYCNGAEPTCPDYQEYLKDTEQEPELTHSEVTKESDQELTEFEEEFLAIVDSWCHGDGRVYKECNKQALKDARLLISIARKQLQPEFDAEIEQAYKNQDEVVYNKGYDKGYNDAIEDACEWLDVNYVHYLDIDGKGTLTANIRQLIEDIKKALEKGE